MEKKPDYLRKRKGLVMHWFLLILLIHLVEGVEISCFVHKELLLFPKLELQNAKHRTNVWCETGKYTT